MLFCFLPKIHSGALLSAGSPPPARAGRGSAPRRTGEKATNVVRRHDCAGLRGQPTRRLLDLVLWASWIRKKVARKLKGLAKGKMKTQKPLVFWDPWPSPMVVCLGVCVCVYIYRYICHLKRKHDDGLIRCFGVLCAKRLQNHTRQSPRVNRNFRCFVVSFSFPLLFRLQKSWSFPQKAVCWCWCYCWMCSCLGLKVVPLRLVGCSRLLRRPSLSSHSESTNSHTCWRTDGPGLPFFWRFC